MKCPAHQAGHFCVRTQTRSNHKDHVFYFPQRQIPVMLHSMAVCMTVLASGSKGNCTVLSSSTASILVDAGLSCRETLKRMKIAGEDPQKLKAIVISHEHIDHVVGLRVLARKLEVPVYITEG